MPCLIKPDMHHTWLCIMPCSCDGCLLCCLLVSGLHLSIASVSLRSFEDPFDFIRVSSSWLILLPCRISSKMTIPSKSLLSLLASCLLFCYAAISTTCYIMPPILPCQASNPSFQANRCLAMLPLLLSPSYSVASCSWRWRLFHVGTWIRWDITISLILINAPIYLVKGGRLGLMPGVLFHSCHPSFHHTGVLFLDFAFLMRLGYNGNPLTVRFE